MLKPWPIFYLWVLSQWMNICNTSHCLTHWGRVTHIWISQLTGTGSGNGLSPGRSQAITWNNAGILLIRPLVTNISEILIEIYTLSFKKKWRPFCLSLNVLRPCSAIDIKCALGHSFIDSSPPGLLFCRQHFQMHLCEWNVLYFD